MRAEELGTPELRRICDDLVETMHAASSAGLAAPQVDVPLRIFAVQVGDYPRYPYREGPWLASIKPLLERFPGEDQAAGAADYA